MIEVVTSENILEYEEFVLRHPRGSFLQSGRWAKQKPEWRWHGFIRRDRAGRITGTMAVLCRKVPVLPRTMLYGCRGPVCDPEDTATLTELLEAVKKLAEKRKAYLVRLDPAISDGPERTVYEQLGFLGRKRRPRYQPLQPRRSWIVPLSAQYSADRIGGNFAEEHLRGIRIALQRGVEVRQGGRELAEAFAALLQMAGLRDRHVARPSEYFASLTENFGDRARIYLAEYEGRTVAGAVTIRYGKKTTCIFEADDGDTARRARYLLRTMMLQQAQEDGSSVCEFTGLPRSRGNREYAFAEGFGGHLAEYVGELDLILRPMTNLISDLVGGLARKVRRWIYFFHAR